MEKEEAVKRIMEKKEYSEIPLKDVEMALDSVSNQYGYDEVSVKKARDLLRRIYSGFGGKKILRWSDRGAREILEKHLSTRERFSYYEEIYTRLLAKLGKKISVIDLGSGTNGFSYDFFQKIGIEVDYLGIEAVGQLVDMTNDYFKKIKFHGRAVHLSLFETKKVINLIKKQKKPRVIFMFKLIDSLEKLERNYTLEFLEELKKLDIEKIVISFATESWFRRKKFYVQRTWLINYIKDNFDFLDDFNLGGERYLVFKAPQ